VLVAAQYLPGVLHDFARADGLGAVRNGEGADGAYGSIGDIVPLRQLRSSRRQ